jgi:hypothetical protein
MEGKMNFAWSTATNLQRFLYEQSFDKEATDNRIRAALLEAATVARAEANMSRKMFMQKIVKGEDSPDRAETGKFLLDQMAEEKRVAEAAMKLLDEFNHATSMKKKMLEFLLKG